MLTRCLAAVALMAVAMTSGSFTVQASQPSTPIYSDSLASGWSDWSWNTDVNWQNSANPHTGSHDIAATFTQGWDAVSAHSDSQIDTTPFDLLQFWINGGSTGGQSLTVYFEDSGNSLGEPVNISPYVTGHSIAANTWKEVQIPLSELGATDVNIDRLDFFNDTNSAQAEILLDDIELVNDGSNPPPTSYDVNVTVNGAADVHAISPYIYGVAFGGTSYLKNNDLTLDRWGGNAITRYNWRLGSASNTASDWYFENTNNGNACTSPGCAVDQTVQADRAAGVASLITVPTIGWVAKNASLDTCGFKVSKYGAQQQTDPYRPNCGNGIKPNGTPITGNDPHDTSVKSTPSDIKAWIQHLVGKFGTAAHGGVRFYAMDNEPELWNSTHRDVHPQPLTYQGLYNEFESYATVVKQVDPSAMIDGPIPWGWSAYFDSSYDYAHNTTSDRVAHGNLPILPWFLKTVRAHDVKTGHRTLNVLDVHYYPQESNVFGNDNDPATDALRLRATRSLWDPTYADESWINDKVDLIPRMQRWIKQYYPGTKFGISEWNFGDEEAMNGALAVADVLGVLGRDNVYLASYWTHPGATAPATQAFDMFRNYDGKDGTFGNRSIEANSNSPSHLMAFAATRTLDKKLTIMLVNQQPTAEEVASLSLKSVSVGSMAQVFELGPGDQSIVNAESIASSTSMSVTVAPNTIELLVIPES
jgi:hypothetical protein